MSHKQRTETPTARAERTLKSVRSALKQQHTVAEYRGLGQQLRKRIGEIDSRLRDLKAPTNPGTGGRAYLDALNQGGPDDLQAIAEERQLLEAERRQLSELGKSIKAERDRAQVREAHAQVAELEAAAAAAEHALATYKASLSTVERRQNKIADALRLAGRTGEKPPDVPAELAVRVARLIRRDGRQQNATRIQVFKQLGVEVTSALVRQAGEAPGEPVAPASDAKAVNA